MLDENSQHLLEQIKNMFEETLLKSTDKKSTVITLEEHYDNYLKNINGTGSSRAFAGKVSIGKQIIAVLGSYRLSDLNISVVSRYINSLPTATYYKNGQNHFYSQSHIDKVYTNLKSVLSAAVHQGLLEQNVMEHIPCPISRQYINDGYKALTDNDIQILLKAFYGNDLWTLKILLHLSTGGRPGEINALMFSDFDFDKETVKIQRTLSLDIVTDIDTKKVISSKPIIKRLKNERKEKKEYARRELKLSCHILNKVYEYKKSIENNPNIYALKVKNGTTDFLFTAPTDGLIKRPDYYCTEYNKLLKRYGLDPQKYSSYNFRHTFCTRLFKIHRLDPKTVQLMMGDNSGDMVMRVYNSVNKNDIIIASEEYARQLERSLGIIN